MSYGQYSNSEKPSKPSIENKSTKRLKHVFDNPAHVWAHPREKDGSGFEQTDARVAGGNWYFKTSQDGTRVVYSYRDSYPIASRFELGRKTIYLLRSGKPYSVTTSGHMSATCGAVPKNDKNVEVFTVQEMVENWTQNRPGKAEHARNVAAYIADITDAIERHGKARSSYNIRGTLNEANGLTAEVKRYARIFKTRLPALPTLPKLEVKKLAQIVERERIRDEKAEAKRLAEREAYEKRHAEEVKAWETGPDRCTHLVDGQPKHSFSDRWECERQREHEEWEATKAEKITAWKRGEDVRLRISYSENALLRVKNGNVETSQGVDVPVSGKTGAARLLRLLIALKESGRTYHTNGHSEHVGSFTVTSFDGETLIAGCHKITWQEILSVSDAVLKAEQTENDPA